MFMSIFEIICFIVQLFFVLWDFIMVFKLHISLFMFLLWIIIVGIFIYLCVKCDERKTVLICVVGMTIGFFGAVVNQDSNTYIKGYIYMHLFICSSIAFSIPLIKERYMEYNTSEARRHAVPDRVYEVRDKPYIIEAVDISVKYINSTIEKQLKNGPYDFVIVPDANSNNGFLGVRTYYIKELNSVNKMIIFTLHKREHSFRSFDFADSEVFLTAIYNKLMSLKNTSAFKCTVESIKLEVPDYRKKYGSISIKCYKSVLSDKDPNDFFRHN